MRLVAYDAGKGPRAGVLRGESVVELTAEGAHGDLESLLGTARPADLRSVPGDGGSPLDEVRLLPPILSPEKIVGIGLNYRSHAEEQGADAPGVPTFFAKFANALAAPGAEVSLPSSGEKVDYEAEVAFVVGSRCRDVDEADALSHLAGYMLLNDLSARDLQFQTPQ